MLLKAVTSHYVQTELSCHLNPFGFGKLTTYIFKDDLERFWNGKIIILVYLAGLELYLI